MKKIVSIALAAMMVICLAIPALAADPTFTADVAKVTSYAGEEVTVLVTVAQDIADIGSGNIEVTFDSGLTLVSGEWLVEDALLADFDDANLRGVFAVGDVTTLTGDIFKLVFKVAADAKTGDVYTVNATLKLKDNAQPEANDIPVAVNAGSVTVVCNHKFSEEWSKDADSHWHECECGEIADKEAHKFGDDWHSDDQNHWKECTCGQKSEVGAHTGTVVKDAKKASCTENGYSGDTYCVCGKLITKGEVIPATGHHFENGKCVDCGIENKNPPTGDTFVLVIVAAVACAAGAVLTLKKRKEN